MPEAASPVPSPLESTADLLTRVRGGDLSARERLIARYLPALRRFAHGRLPLGARGVAETDDLVQNTVIRALNHLDRFEPRREGAFLAYLRQILMNQIRDESRRIAARPGRVELSPQVAADDPSPLDVTIGRENVEIYEAALATLSPVQRECIVLRLELGLSYAEVAQAMAGRSPNAARMVIARGMVRLAEAIRDLRGQG